MILPEVKASEASDGIGRPIRLDLPWVRNLSWIKIHSMQLGFAVALVIYFGLTLGYIGTSFGLAVLIIEAAFGEIQENTDITVCEHDIGWHDFREKPWYGISVGMITLLLLSLIWGVPV